MKTQWFYKGSSAFLIVMLAVVALPVTPARAADTGFFNANQTIASNSVANPNNGWTSNDQYATFNTSTDTSDYGYPDLGIPVGAVIDGIEVTIEGQRNGGGGVGISMLPYGTRLLLGPIRLLK